MDGHHFGSRALGQHEIGQEQRRVGLVRLDHRSRYAARRAHGLGQGLLDGIGPVRLLLDGGFGHSGEFQHGAQVDRIQARDQLRFRLGRRVVGGIRQADTARVEGSARLSVVGITQYIEAEQDRHARRMQGCDDFRDVLGLADGVDLGKQRLCRGPRGGIEPGLVLGARHQVGEKGGGDTGVAGLGLGQELASLLLGAGIQLVPAAEALGARRQRVREQPCLVGVAIEVRAGGGSRRAGSFLLGGVDAAGGNAEQHHREQRANGQGHGWFLVCPDRDSNVPGAVWKHRGRPVAVIAAAGAQKRTARFPGPSLFSGP